MTYNHTHNTIRTLKGILEGGGGSQGFQKNWFTREEAIRYRDRLIYKSMKQQTIMCFSAQAHAG